MTTVHSRRSRKLSVDRLEGRDNPTPVLGYSTYTPGVVLAEAVDAAGNAYLAENGATVIKLNPTGTAAIYSTQWLGGDRAVGIAVDGAGDAFVLLAGDRTPMSVVELDPTGTNVLYSYAITGTSSGESVGGWMTATDAGIALDGAGNVYVTGVANAGLPTTPGAFQTTSLNPNGSAFLAKLNPTLSGSASVIYCTYLGGSGDTSGHGDAGAGVAVDAAGNAYVTGFTSSANFPTTAGAFQRVLKGGFDAFVAKINPNLSGPAPLLYSTYLGGSGGEGYLTDVVFGPDGTAYGSSLRGAAIAVDSSGNAYVTGYTRSSDFPVTTGAFQTKSGISNATGGVAFVTKLNAAGSGLVYSTFLGTGYNANKHGSSRNTFGTAIALDGAGDAYVTGLTPSTTFPLVNPLQAAQAGAGDVFVSTLNPTGKSLLFSTYLGGTASDVGMAIAIGPNNNTYVGGDSFSTFPVTPGAYITTRAPYGDAGVAFMIDPPVSSPLIAQVIQPPVSSPLDATVGQLLGTDNRSKPRRTSASIAISGPTRSVSEGLVDPFTTASLTRRVSVTETPSSGGALADSVVSESLRL